MSHRPGFELSKQATRKDIPKAALPINQEEGSSVVFQSLSASRSFGACLGPRAAGKWAEGPGGYPPGLRTRGQFLETPLGRQRPDTEQAPAQGRGAGRARGRPEVSRRGWASAACRPKASHLLNQLQVTRGNGEKSRDAGLQAE